LRDLVDIDRLLRSLGQTEGFWQVLQRDAIGNDLAQPVALGLHLAQRMLGTPVPSEVLLALESASERPPSVLLNLFARALTPSPDGDAAQAPGAALANWLLYVRSHVLRMPLRLVVPHLLRKAWMGWFPEKPQPSASASGR